MSDEDRVGRRRFFRAALGEFLKPLERKAAPLGRALREFDVFRDGDRSAAPDPASGPAGPTVRAPTGRTAARDGGGKMPLQVAWLRPPGALPEPRFTQTCSRCGDCVQVCPAQCIKIEPDGRGDGFPFIDVESMPCVLCDGLLCMHKCPTNALSAVPLELIDMGTAVWNEQACVRTRHEECTNCIDQCPIGSAAIGLADGKIQVIEEGCVGCGVCEHYCPSVPKSITVTPRGGP